MAVADPEQALRIAQTVADLYEQAELELLEAVAKRLARGITQPGWAEKKLAETQQLRREAQKVVRRLATKSEDAVVRAIQQAAFGEVAVTPSLAPKTQRRAVQALVDETVRKTQSTHFQILRSVDDIYRRVIAQTGGPGVTTGSMSVQRAVQRSMAEFAARGIFGFVDAKGRPWKMRSYVEMAVRTSSARAMVGSRLQQYVNEDRHLVIVSDSPDECEKCRPWEGKILAIDGVMLTDEERRLADGTVSEAQAGGLFHPNCTHDLRPYIVGLTKPFETSTDQEGERLRKAKQDAQRKLNRARREDVATKPFGDSPVRDRVKAKLAKAQADYDAIPDPPKRPSSPVSETFADNLLDDDSFRTLARRVADQASDETREAFIGYTSRGEYGDINGFLRTGRLIETGRLDETDIRKRIDALDRGFIPTDRAMTVKRVTDGAEWPEGLDDVVGKTFSEKGYLSTTRLAEEIDDVVYHFDVPKGTPHAPIGEGMTLFEEGEILLPRGTTWKVIGKEVRDGKTHLYMKADEIPKLR